MIRRPVVAAAILLPALVALAPAAFSQSPPGGIPSLPPDADTNRFSYHRTNDGFARLDLRTGQVSLCSLRSAGWACQAAPDDRTAFESEISRLQAENAALKKAMLDRGLPLPSGVKPEAVTPAPEAGRSGDADLDRALNFVERAWRRLIEMMGNLQRDLGKT
ncbi:hypothetical protein [Rhodoplanes roseus]|uniref:Uncharacterized protein n=1 Tax=Rhodoplanes roseus TaxID=29409 RepID=A0A327KZC4_9BRAD|nr:hypothetical protein [Rhodoplanes roseus]RAI42975.1 hypothetical protein CH341_16715 [Rhodoplanes roseus]